MKKQYTFSWIKNIAFATVISLASCSTVYNGQTVDDVYYSPTQEVMENKKAEAEYKKAYNEITNEREQNFLTQKIRNYNRWSSLDDYDYWYDSRYGHYSINNRYYNTMPYYGSGSYYNYAWSNPYYNPNTYYYSGNNYYYGSNYQSVYIPVKPVSTLPRTSVVSTSKLNTYNNTRYNNGNYSNNNNNNKYSEKSVNNWNNNSSSNNSSSTPTYTPPAPSSNAGGNSGGYNTTGSSSSKPRGGRG